jgi:hypothetical protein
VPEAAKARGRKGADSQKQNLKVRGVHSVFTAQRYQIFPSSNSTPFMQLKKKISKGTAIAVSLECHSG